MNISLTMSYFHTGIRTIIGAEAFHCPVRDGKEWYHLAMVIKLNRLLAGLRLPAKFVESMWRQLETAKAINPDCDRTKIIGSSRTSN